MRKLPLYAAVLLLCNTSFAEEQSTIAAKLAQQQPTSARAQNAISGVDGLFILPLGKMAGKSAESSTAMQDAKNLRQQAYQAMQKGDYGLAINLAEEAKKRYFEAVRSATPDKVRSDRQEAEFKQKLETVEPLIEALRKTGREYNKNTSDTELRASGLIREAKQYASTRRFDEGRNLLDKAATLINSTMSNMTHGVTQTAPKDNSPKGVYEYAKFTNDTYRAMVEMVLDPKNRYAIASDANALNDVRQGDLIRKEALGIAARGAYPEATQRMAESSSYFKRVARAAGMPIQDAYD